MKTTIYLTALSSALLFAAGSAHADPSGEEVRATKSTNLSLGVSVGEPSGLSARLGFRGGAFALAAGMDYDRHTHVHLDYLANVAHIPTGPTVAMPIYVGVGAFVKDHPDDLGPHSGVRVPVGLQVDFSPPIQLYGEVAPRVVVFDPDEMYPHQTVDVSGALGVRARF